jgi:glucosyl-3-phosphoglycerate synthase
MSFLAEITGAEADMRLVSAFKVVPRVAVCIPARNEEATVGGITAAAARLRAAGLVHQVVVVDDASEDATAARALSAGATVCTSSGGPGKGQALAAAVAACDADILVFLDADVTNFSAHFITDLVDPLLRDASLHLVKASYERPLGGVAGEGGRVTELLARPLLRRLYPELAAIRQPLAGECAVRRSVLEGLTLANGYGVEIGLLIDIYLQHGLRAIAEVGLGERVHRNRPLNQLAGHADDILDAVANRLDSVSAQGRKPL